MRIRHSLRCAFAVAFVTAPALGATTAPKLIGGSGPIDRPSAHVNYWCFHEWSCATVDQFTADGATATVVLRARNWDSYQPSSPMNIRIDNFAVVELAAYQAGLTFVGGVSGSFLCSTGPTDTMLDLANLPPSSVVYASNFPGSIGPGWSYDPNQVGYLASGTYENPFAPGNPITTGAMQLGSGSGPEFVEATLALSGLTAGQSYAVSYWWRSADEDDFPQNCAAPNDDFEIQIFGEELVCVPDPAQLVISDLQTIAWDPTTRIWRFYAILQNLGAGAADKVSATVEDAAGGIEILGTQGWLESLPAGASAAVGPHELDLSGYAPGGGGLTLLFLIDHENDCGAPESGTVDFVGSSNPGRYPTDAAAAVKTLQLAQNRPNPFNPSTQIAFELPAPGPVELAIFDLRGQRVRSLLQAWREAGPHSLQWDGRDDDGLPMPSGSYFYRLRAGESVQVRRMLLLK